jgi:hypothetical protein
MKKRKKPCRDCNKFLYQTSPYMVGDDLWNDAGLHPNEKCCLTCLSNRLGRKIKIKEFTTAPCNDFIKEIHETTERW